VIDALWQDVEWDWHTRGEAALFWHWSPVYDWEMNARIRGWNECLVTYVLAAGSPTHAIAPEVYHRCFASGPTFLNGRTYDGLALPLGPEGGGPLFFSHYSFLGIDPRGLRDRYAAYWQQNRTHTLINRAYCIANPKGFAGYGADCWGLTASDSIGGGGYIAHFVGHATHFLGAFAPEVGIVRRLRHPRPYFPCGWNSDRLTMVPQYSMKWALRRGSGALWGCNEAPQRGEVACL